MPTAATATKNAPATSAATVAAAPAAPTWSGSLDDLIGAYSAVLAGFKEIPEDLGFDSEGVEDELIEGLAAFAEWVGFADYNPDTIKTFSATPKKEGGFYFGGLRLAPVTDDSGGTALLWGGHEIPLGGTIGNFTGDWLAQPSQEKDPKNPDKQVWRLTVTNALFGLTFRPRLLEDLKYSDLSINSWEDLAKVLAVSSNRRSLSDFAGQSIIITSLSVQTSKNDKQYGVFEIAHESGAKESIYALSLDQLAGVTYPATGVIDETAEQLMLSGNDGKSFTFAIPRRGEFTSLAKMPIGEYTVVAAYEENSDKFGVQTKVDVLDADGKCLKVGLNAVLKRQLKYLPQPSTATPLTLHIDGRSVESGGRRVLIDGETWTMDLETKEVKANGVIQKTDGKVYVDARLTQPVTEARPKSKLEVLAAKAREAKERKAALAAEAVVEVATPVSAFS